MKSKEEINMLGFTIVAYAGDARSDLMDALARLREMDILNRQENWLSLQTTQ
ncbi:lactose-specific phosphotransferase EIIA [Streptococcus pneumoniae]|nr:lactose-specific phosphotransferase EIIA [Streptococcus pneumoniae]CWJ82305.1 lactose-specific phosphotransferase EIIA [Streptococcus pneumoniae]